MNENINRIFARLSTGASITLLLVMYLLTSFELYILWNWLGVPTGVTNQIGFFTAMFITLIAISIGALGKIILWCTSKNIP